MQHVSDIISSINKELEVIEKEINKHTKFGDDAREKDHSSTGFPPSYLLNLNGFIVSLAEHNKKLIKILQDKHIISDVNNDKKKIMKSLQKLKDREERINAMYHRVLKFAAEHNLIEMKEGDHSPRIGSNPIIYKFSKGSIDSFLKSKLELEHAINSIRDTLEVNHKRLHGVRK